MTARINTGVLGAMIDPTGRPTSGNALALSDYGDLRKLEPGTLWERVADSAPTLDRYLLALGVGRNSMHSARDTMRRILDQSALERAKAAHPAGKGIKKEGQE